MTLLLLAAALSAGAQPGPPPALRVCLEVRPESPCQTGPIAVEGEVTAFGAGGVATLRWLVDGQTRREAAITLTAGVPSHNLLLLTPRASRHALRLEVGVGTLRGYAALALEPSFCPFDLGVDTVVVEPGRDLIAVVANRGPAPSGSWGLRMLVDGRRFYDSPMDSLSPGQRYELVVPWTDLPPAERDRAPGGPGDPVRWSAARAVLVLLDTSAGDLDPGNDAFEILLPR